MLSKFYFLNKLNIFGPKKIDDVSLGIQEALEGSLCLYTASNSVFALSMSMSRPFFVSYVLAQ